MLIKNKLLGFETKEISRKREKFYSQFLSTGDLYFDIGANYGNRIAPIINKDIKIVAIEPQKECIKYLKLRFGSKINIVPQGLGESESIETMYISNNHVLSSFSKEWIDSTKESGRFSKYKWNKKRKIQITTFDEIIKKYGKPSFAKIDVEGYELNVLKGLNSPIKVISLEYTVPERTKQLIQCIERLNSLSVNGIKCNYSIGESMEWATQKWLNYEETIQFIQSEQFVKTQFGDIYIESY